MRSPRAGESPSKRSTLIAPRIDAKGRHVLIWPPSWFDGLKRSLALILLADALGQRGEATGAAKALSHAEARHGMKSALFAPELALARTWTRLAERDREGAISAVREAARTAEGGGQSAVALRAPHDAVRLGDPGDIDRIIRLAREVDCVASRLALAHGLALASGDAATLEAVAAQLDHAGLHPAAVDATAQAQRCGGRPVR